MSEHQRTVAPHDTVLTYLGLGSNMDEPRLHVRQAVADLDAVPLTEVLRVSPLYGSEPWGKVDQADFVNAVVEVETSLSPGDLLKAIKAIERAHGRVEGERWGQRPLDIDILLYGTESQSEPDLEIPHPRMWDRAFVLRPLADLRPDLTGPGGQSVLKRLDDYDIAGQETWLLE